MKKIGVIIIVTIIILCGCTGKISEDSMIYKGYVEELKELDNVTTSEGIVDINIELEKNAVDEITYRITIDDPKIKMRQIEAIAYHNFKTEAVFPSIGVYDEKLNLVPGLKKNDRKNVKGLVLIGYIKTDKSIRNFHPTIKVMMLYNDKYNERQKIYYTKTF